MEKMTISKIRGAYAKQVDKEVRGFNSYLKEIRKDFEDYAAKKQAANERQKLAFETFGGYAFTGEKLTLDYLRNWLPCIDTKNRICDFKVIAIEDEKQARQDFPDFDFIENVKGQILMLKPVSLWTANKLLTKFSKAAAAERAAANAVAAAEREKQRAENEAKRIAAYREKVAEFDAKQAAVKKAESKQKASK